MKLLETFRLFCPPIIIIIFNKIKKGKIGKEALNSKFDLSIKRKEELILLGNSPSLSILDLSAFVNQHIYFCNDFFRHPEFSKVLDKNNVTYFAMDSYNSWQRNFPNRHELESEIYKYYSQIFSTKYLTIIPQDLFDYFEKNQLFVDCRIQALNLNDISRLFKSKLKETTITTEVALNVRHTPQAMIIQGIISGFKSIKMFGLQHSYVRDRFNCIGQVNHFYEEDSGCMQQMMHRDLTELFLDSHLTFKVYKELNLAARFFDVEIVDCTADGCLDMFKKLEFSPN